MKKIQNEENFEKKIALILQEELFQISEEDLQTGWIKLRKRIKFWEQAKERQNNRPNHQRDTNNLGDNAGKSIICSKK